MIRDSKLRRSVAARTIRVCTLALAVTACGMAARAQEADVASQSAEGAGSVWRIHVPARIGLGWLVCAKNRSDMR